MCIEESCSLCKFEVETGTHIFRDCKLARDVWSLLPFGKLVFGPSPSDPLSWIKYIAWVLCAKDWCWFVFGVWELWNQRTAFFRDEKVRSAGEIVEVVSAYVDEFCSAQALCMVQRPPAAAPRRRNPVWKLPPAGWLKINCDASLDLQAANAGVGIVIRDHLGKVVECAALKKTAIKSVATLEAIAVFDGVRMAVNRGAQFIQVESDAEVVVNCLNGNKPVFAVFLELTKRVTCVSFCYLNRRGNQAAHGLAKLSLSENDSKHWLFCFPESISDAIHHDVEL